MSGNNAPSAPEGTPTKTKTGRKVIRVILFVVLGIAGVAAAAAYGTAETGIVNVPFFSRWYTGPEPTRAVTASPLSSEQFQSRVVGRLSDSIYTGVPPYGFTVTEAELTGALKSTVQDAIRDREWDTDLLQIAVFPSGLEFTAHLKNGDLRFDFQALFIPIVEDGGLRFEAAEIHLGDIPLHPQLGMRIAGAVFSRDFGTWVFRLGAITFDKVVLKDGTVQATVLITK